MCNLEDGSVENASIFVFDVLTFLKLTGSKYRNVWVFLWIITWSWFKWNPFPCLFVGVFQSPQQGSRLLALYQSPWVFGLFVDLTVWAGQLQGAERPWCPNMSKLNNVMPPATELALERAYNLPACGWMRQPLVGEREHKGQKMWRALRLLSHVRLW